MVAQGLYPGPEVEGCKRGLGAATNLVNLGQIDKIIRGKLRDNQHLKVLETFHFRSNDSSNVPLLCALGCGLAEIRTVRPTLAPIWFPHCPACRWTISLMLAGVEGRCGV